MAAAHLLIHTTGVRDAAGAAQPDRRYRALCVLTRPGGRWLIAEFHNVQVSAH